MDMKPIAELVARLPAETLDTPALERKCIWIGMDGGCGVIASCTLEEMK